jgi:hypothetical protein
MKPSLTALAWVQRNLLGLEVRDELLDPVSRDLVDDVGGYLLVMPDLLVEYYARFAHRSTARSLPAAAILDAANETLEPRKRSEIDDTTR